MVMSTRVSEPITDAKTQLIILLRTHHDHRRFKPPLSTTTSVREPASTQLRSTALTSRQNARTACSRFLDAERRLPPNSPSSFTPFDRHYPVPTPAEEPRYSTRCRTQEGVWRLEGPGSHLSEPVWTSWRGSEECDEIWRLAQDEGDHLEGTRMGVYTLR